MNRYWRDSVQKNGPVFSRLQATLIIGLISVFGLFLAFVAIRFGGMIGDVPFGLVMLTAMIGATIVYFVTYHEQIWVYCALGTVALFGFGGILSESSVNDYLYDLFVIGGLVLWYFKEIFILRNRLVHSRFDFLFLLIVILWVVIPTINFFTHDNVIVLTYIKEFLGAASLPFYFPLRKAMRDDNSCGMLLGILIGVTLINGANSVLYYRENVIESVMKYGAVNARSTMNEPMSAFLLIAGFVAMAFARRFRHLLLGIIATGLGAALLAITLSRGPIAAGVAGIFATILVVPVKRFWRSIALILIVLAVNIGLLSYVLPGLSQSILTNIGGRIATLSQVGSDASLGSRVYESEAVLEKYVRNSPVLGYGYGVQYRFYNAPFHVTNIGTFIHNGYVHAFYKFGIPAALLIILGLMMPLLRVPYSSYSQLPHLHRGYLALAVGLIVMLLITNLTSITISYHPQQILICFALALFDYVYSTLDPTVMGSRKALARSWTTSPRWWLFLDK